MNNEETKETKAQRPDDKAMVAAEVVQAVKGRTLAQISKGLLEAIDPDAILAQAKQGKAAYVEPTEKEMSVVRAARI